MKDYPSVHAKLLNARGNGSLTGGYGWDKHGGAKFGKGGGNQSSNNGTPGSQQKLDKKRRSLGPQDFGNIHHSGGRGGGFPLPGGMPRNRSNNNIQSMTDNHSGGSGHRNHSVSGTGYNQGKGNGGNFKNYTTPPSSDSKSRMQHHSVDGSGANGYHHYQRYMSNSPGPYVAPDTSSTNSSTSSYGMVGMPDPTAPSFIPHGTKR